MTDTGKTAFKRSSLLGTAIALALYGQVSVVQAQQTNDRDRDGSQDSEQIPEEIIVRGIRGSLQSSLDTKRDANAFVDAITAEDVGKFPDKNLAEALQRIPGVVINREFGEGERVNLRGTSSSLTRTLLNGHTLATADWFILDQLNTTRSFNYLMLPSDIIGKVEVYKSPRADLEEGGIGGIIDVQTRQPLDLPSGTVSASLQAVHTDLADETDPYFSGLYSWKSEDETVGFLASVIHQERNIRRDGVEVLGYFETDIDAGAGVQNALVPSLIGSALFEQERIRTGANFSVQFKPNENLQFNVNGLYSKFEADNINSNFLAWGVRAIGNGGTITDTTIIDDTAVAGTISSLNGGTEDFSAVYDVIDRFATAETRNIDFDGTYNRGEWSFDFRLGYTDAEGNTDAQPFVEFGAPGTFSYDLTGETPEVRFHDIDPTNPNDLSFIFSSLHQILNDDSESYGYFNAERFLDRGMLTSVKFGFKATNHDRDLIFNATTYGGFHVPLNTTPASAFAGALTPGDYLSGIGGAGTLDSYWQTNRGSVQEILFGNLATAGRIPYPQQNFSIEEDTLGGYVMANFNSDRWRGNVGVRVVETDLTASGNVVSPLGGTENPFGNFDPVRVNNTYTDVLPSVNFVYDLQDDLLLRMAAAKVIARPDYTDVAPRANLNPGALTGSTGNPNLDPFEANQLDLSLEWYPRPGAAVAFALYYKDIKSFITDNPVSRVFSVQAQSAPNAACTEAGPNLFNCPFLVNERTNGGGGTIQGFEVAATWPLVEGFGVQTNYTYADAEADNNDPIPGASEDQINVALFYENDRISTRLAYTYRSDFFVTFDRSTRLNQKSLDSLDASFSYRLNDTMALAFDAVNLTDEPIEQFASDTFRPRAILENGRIYYVGLRFSY